MKPRIIVIGAGPGGYIAAVEAAMQGADVTLIEAAKVGGTCLNSGCIPTKIFKATAEYMEKLNRAQEFGLAVKGPMGPDMERLLSRKQRIVADQANGIMKLLSEKKVRYVQGSGYIAGPAQIGVKTPDQGTMKLSCDKLILATGSKPQKIPRFPFDGDKILSSDDALCMHKLPESILIVGGGVIGCEFASIFAALGSKVILIEALPRLLPLPGVDEDCSKILQRELKKRKVHVIVNRMVDRIDAVGDRCKAYIGSPSDGVPKNNGESMSFEVEKVLVCIGRSANHKGIGLENIGISMANNGWIDANANMETNVAGVYAIGDALGPSKSMLAHVASAEGRIAADNAMGGQSKMNYDLVPIAIYTIPEVANIGLSEVQAKERGYPTRSDKVLFRTIGKAQVIGEIEGEAKIISDAESGKILGVHLIGPHATELIAEGVLAIKMGATLRDLSETVHAHPTLSEIMLELSLQGIREQRK